MSSDIVSHPMFLVICMLVANNGCTTIKINVGITCKHIIMGEMWKIETKVVERG